MEAINQRGALQEVVKLRQVIQIDERKIQEHLGKVVRKHRGRDAKRDVG